MRVPISHGAACVVFQIRRIVLPSGPVTLSGVFTCLGLCLGYPDSLGAGASKCVPLSSVGSVQRQGSDALSEPSISSDLLQRVAL